MRFDEGQVATYMLSLADVTMAVGIATDNVNVSISSDLVWALIFLVNAMLLAAGARRSKIRRFSLAANVLVCATVLMAVATLTPQGLFGGVWALMLVSIIGSVGLIWFVDKKMKVGEVGPWNSVQKNGS